MRPWAFQPSGRRICAGRARPFASREQTERRSSTLKPAADDYIVTKVRSSAFHETKLETLLRVKDVWILIVAGGSTNWGVEWLARDAKSRDIVTVALRDCTYSATDEAQAASLANIDDFLGYVMNSDEVVEMLKR
ncbi:MAG TPA: isochorismatase family protein [Bradyrhizobium sp.]